MKGLEALKELKGVLTYFGAHTEKAIESCNTIEKELKALEIIKNRECIFKGLQDVSQEEYELLKEIL